MARATATWRPWLLATSVAALAVAISYGLGRVHRAEVRPRSFNAEELSRYDGEGDLRTIYLAIRGRVYDVTSGRRFYGKGQTYNIFAGRDASRGYLGKNDPPLDRIDDLDEHQLRDLNGWIRFYDSHEVYRYVGWVEDGGSWSDGLSIGGIHCLSSDATHQLNAWIELYSLQALGEVPDGADSGLCTLVHGNEFANASVSIRSTAGGSDSCGSLGIQLDDGGAVEVFSIPTPDPLRSVAFYQQSLGFELSSEGRIRARPPKPFLRFTELPEDRNVRGGFVIVLFVLDVFRAADALGTRVRKIQLPSHPETSWSTSVSDPDGNEVLLLGATDVQHNVHERTRQAKVEAFRKKRELTRKQAQARSAAP